MNKKVKNGRKLITWRIPLPKQGAKVFKDAKKYDRKTNKLTKGDLK
jgi:hypothetical protein